MNFYRRKKSELIYFELFIYYLQDSEKEQQY